MPLTLQNIEFLNQNSLRKYPIAEHVDCLDQTGSFEIPTDFIVSLYLPISTSVSVTPVKFYIYSINIFESGYSVEIAYDNSGTTILVAVTAISKSGHTENSVYALSGVNEFSDSVGKIVIGRLDNINLLPAGRYVFNPTSTYLDQDAIRPMLRSVSGFRVQNGTDISDTITGIVRLVSGSNMRITHTVLDDGTNELRFDAIAGEGLTDDCVCDGAVVGPPIRTINNIEPASDGDYTLLVNDCIQATPIANGLLLEDLCSKPCCGYDELNIITQELKRLGDGAATLNEVVNRMSAESTIMISRVDSLTCVEC